MKLGVTARGFLFAGLGVLLCTGVALAQDFDPETFAKNQQDRTREQLREEFRTRMKEIVEEGKLDGLPDEIKIIKVAAGPEMGMVRCPCFRWVIQVEVGEFRFETKEVVLSSDALFELRMAKNLPFDQFTRALFKAGTLDLLWKKGHIGIGFDGVMWGGDFDRAIGQIVQTAVYASANAILNEFVRLDIRSGYEFQKFRVNAGDWQEKHMLPQSVVLNWETRRWTGNVSASYLIDANHPGNFKQHSVRASAQVRHRWRFARDSIEMGLGLQASVWHEPWLEEYGIKPTHVTVSLMLDLAVDAIGALNRGQSRRRLKTSLFAKI